MVQLAARRPQFFYTTAPMPCPYQKGRLERKIFTELSGNGAGPLHDALSRVGFRRSHSIAYAPACAGCSDCVPVRVVVKDFIRRRTLRRIWNQNADLTATEVTARATIEQFHLFSRYQSERHASSDMALMGFYDYRAMVEESPIETVLGEFRDQDGLLRGVCLTDRMQDGLSAVYSFFDPSLTNRSLGTFLVLWLIEQARRQDLPYVYLGYWIRGSRKMAYKSRFQPLEAYGPGGWSRMADESSEVTEGE